jgi:hypothetical protein
MFKNNNTCYDVISCCLDPTLRLRWLKVSDCLTSAGEVASLIAMQHCILSVVG